MYYNPILLQLVNKICLNQTLRAGKLSKEQYDRRARAGTLNAASRVLVKVLAFDGIHKIAGRWEHEPYT